MSIESTIDFKLEYNNAPLMLIIDEKRLNLEAKRKEAKDFGLHEKDEFHITIIGSDLGKIILHYFDTVAEPKKTILIDKFTILCKSFNRQVKLSNKFYYIKQCKQDATEGTVEVRESIIQSCKICHLSIFYRKLNLLLSQMIETPFPFYKFSYLSIGYQKLSALFCPKFKVPFPHVTLYTTSNLEEKKLRGIAIHSKEHFKTLMPIKL